MSHKRVTASDGVSLAVHESGDPAAPTVLAVHGYPDDHTVWDGVVAELADRFHVVSYDVRGAGESTAPASRAGYRLDQLAADLAAVAAAVSPRRPVHLLAHDWGSIQAWHAVTGGALDGGVASFTSISGPDLDHAGAWFRSRLRRPTPRRLRELFTQLAASGYIGFFQLPGLPELAWRSGLLPRAMSLLTRGDAGLRRPATSDAVRGLGLYRENMLSHLTRPRPARAEVPVQVLAPTRDPFVTAPLQSDLAGWVPEPRVRRIPGGHWLPRSHPGVVARCVTELVEHVEGGGEPAPALRRARERAAARDRHGGSLVVITGAGSGIGRATALAFADRGARVVVADRDEPSAVDTCRQVAGRGAGVGIPYRVDVADAEAMAGFAKWVLAEHGVPDVVVNNAGIGMAGPFAETTLDEWRRIIDVNLWGVIHGCRVFGAPMVAHGEGGRIVNIASAAAYLPSRALPAYSTTKSAVLMLSECLRGELAEHGIGVVAVCPGFVHTNITATTRFVGTDDTEQDRRQRATYAAYGRRNYTPERAAREIVRAVERNTALAPVTPEARLGLALSRLTPAVLRAAARREINL
ncbi:SDR family oxidoreductase [Pseudonocardia acaciae]|uniref:SDR family oxidoreductase n=1 Tax=Pseudonocardia acaciae TaxID=551276 RepID=UPI0004903DB2|nr:SDR family oxidoreductase [Pseudonocardia acaciae]